MLPVLRLLEFRPQQLAFDATLRDRTVPGLLALPGVLDVFAGRSGPDETGRRLVASLWQSQEAMVAALGADEGPGLRPDALEGATDHWLVHVPLRFAFPARPIRAGVLRVVRGQVRAGEIEDYVRESREGTESDIAAGIGPIGLYLATPAPDRFLTLSVWPDWDSLLAATGGDYRRPIATRHAQRLVAWEADHFEALPDLPRPSVAERAAG